MMGYQTECNAIKGFCEKTGLSRFSITRTPFSIAWHVYATDGHVIVRTIAPVCGPYPDDPQPILDVVTEFNWQQCNEATERWPTYAEMRGLKEAIEIGNRNIDIAYARRISRLKNVRYCGEGQFSSALPFRNDQYEGLIMPRVTYGPTGQCRKIKKGTK